MILLIQIPLWVSALGGAVIGAWLAIAGPANVIPGVDDSVHPALDSETRFLAVFFFAYGISCLKVSRDVYKHQKRIVPLAVTMLTGALVRLVSWSKAGAPGQEYQIGIVVEFVVGYLMLLGYWLEFLRPNTSATPKKNRIDAIGQLESAILFSVGLAQVLYMILFVDYNETSLDIFCGGCMFGSIYMLTAVLLWYKVRGALFPTLLFNITGFVRVTAMFEISPLAAIDPYLIMVDLVSLSLLVYLYLNQRLFFVPP